MLYLLYTANFPIALGITTATYADDTVILTAHNKKHPYIYKKVSSTSRSG